MCGDRVYVTRCCRWCDSQSHCKTPSKVHFKKKKPCSPTKIIEKTVIKENDVCLQLEKAIAEQKTIVAYYTEEILRLGDKIKECTEGIDMDGSGTINLPEEQNIQLVINNYNLMMQNLIHAHNNALVTLQAMLVQNATCANPPT